MCANSPLRFPCCSHAPRTPSLPAISPLPPISIHCSHSAFLSPSLPASSTMYIMAAVGIDVEAFRGRNPHTPMTEVCLACVRSYNASSLLEVRPGFSDQRPLDRAALTALTRTISGDAAVNPSAAVAALVAADIKLGVGKFGGMLRVRPVPGSDGDGAGVLGRGRSGSDAGVSVSGARDSADVGRSTSMLPPLAADRTSSIIAYALETHR